MTNKVSSSPKPSRSTFHTVMNAWEKSHSRNSGRKAEDIYTLLEKLSSLSSVTNNDNNRNMNRNNSHSLCPNAQSLAIVFDAWANSSH